MPISDFIIRYLIYGITLARILYWHRNESIWIWIAINQVWILSCWNLNVSLHEGNVIQSCKWVDVTWNESDGSKKLQELLNLTVFNELYLTDCLRSIHTNLLSSSTRWWNWIILSRWYGPYLPDSLRESDFQWIICVVPLSKIRSSWCEG